MSTYEVWSLFINTTGVAILGIYTTFTYKLYSQAQKQTGKAQEQLEIARDSAKINHLMTLVTQFGTEPMSEIRRALAQKRLEGDPEPPEARDILDFFEVVGFLLKRNYLDVRDVWDMFSYWVFPIFMDFRCMIEQEQKDDASYYRDFTSLASRLRELEHAEGYHDDTPSATDIEEFWKEELKNKSGINRSWSRGKKRKSR